MALVLTGTPQFAVAPLSTTTTYDSAFTVACTFKTGAVVTGSAQVVACIAIASGAFRGFAITIDTDGYIKIASNGAGSDNFGTSASPWTNVIAAPNTIYTVVMRKASGATGNISGYVDSITNTYSRSSMSNTQTLTRIGLGTNLASPNYRYFAGKIVRVAFWPSALSDADISVCLDKSKTPVDCSVQPQDYWLAVANDSPTLPVAGSNSIVRSGSAVYDSDPLLTSVMLTITNPIIVGGSFSFTGAAWAGGTFTSITTNVTGATVSGITGSTTSGSATLANWADGAVYAELPTAATFTFNDGTATNTIGSNINAPAGYTKLPLVDPAFIAHTLANELLIQAGRTVATGDIFYHTTYGDLIIPANTDWTATGNGTFNLWLRVAAGADAGKMFYYNVTITDGGVIIITGGLTALGLTARGLTARGLTARGL